MSENSTVLAICGGVAGVFGLLVKFIINTVFENLQTQINSLRDDSEKQEAEIITLRNMVDEWQEKYHKLNTEHGILQNRHQQLQWEFNAMKAKVNP